MANTEIGIRLRLDSSGVVTGIQAAGQQMQALEKSTAGAASAAAHFARMGHLATSALGLRELVQAADAYSTLTSRIKLASEGIGDAARAQAELFDIASRARTSVESLSQTYAGLARAAGESGRSQTEMLRTTETIAKAMSIGGGAVESQKAALMQFSQALSAGTLRGEELNSVVEQAPRLAKALADGLGISTGALKKFAEEGKITSDAIFMALERSGAKIDAEAARIPSTVGQAMTVLGDQFMQAVGTFDQAYQVSAKLADGILALGRNLDVVIPVVALATAGLLAYRNQALLATVATRGLGTAVGVMSGPIGWVATALGLGAAAWLAWKDAGVSSEQAVEKQVVDSNAEIQSRIDAQIQKLRERNRIAAEGMPDVLTGVQRTAADAAAKYAQAYSSWQSLSKLTAAPAKPATGASFMPSLGGVDELLMPSDRLAQRQREAASAAAKAFAEYQELIGEASRQASASTKKSHEDFLKSYRTGAEKVADALKDYESKFKPKLAAGEITQADYDRGYKAVAASAPKATTASRDYARAVDSELASLQAKVQAEAQYATQLAQHGLAAAKMTDGEKEAAKIGYELARAQEAKAQATTKDGRSKIEARIATLNLHMAEAVRLADVQRQNQITKESLELGQKAITDLQKQADAIRDKTAALAEENAAYGQINPTLAKALAQSKDLAGQMVMTDGSVLDYERAQRAAEAWSLMNGYIGQLMKQDWNKINGAVQEWQRSATEQAKLYEDEARLSGLSALERAKVVAARQVELKLAKQIAEIERAKFSEDPVKDAAQKAKLIADATTAAQTESSAAVAKVVQEDWTRTSEKIEEVLIDALMDGGKSGAEYIEDLFRTMVLRPVLQVIVSPVAGAVTSALGLPGGSAAGGGGLMGLANTASGLNNLYNIGASAANWLGLGTATATGLGLSAAMGTGTALAATGTGLGLSAGLGAGYGFAAGGGLGLTAASAGAGTIGAGLGTSAAVTGAGAAATGGAMSTLGAAMPWIGGALIVDQLFGGKISSGLGKVLGMGDGKPRYVYQTGGGDFEDKVSVAGVYGDIGMHDNGSKNLDAAAFKETFQAIADLDATIAATLSPDQNAQIKTALDNYVSGKNESTADYVADRMRIMADVIGGGVNELVDQFGGTSDELVGYLLRLTQAQPTIDALAFLGKSLGDTEAATLSAALALENLVGGQQNLLALTSSYYTEFYTEAERSAHATQALTEALASIGVDTVPATREAFRDLVDAQDLTTESGRETAAGLLGLHGAFAALVPATEAAANAVDGMVDAVETIEQAYQRLTNVTFTAEQAAEQRINLEEQLLQLQGNTTELRRRELQAIDASNRGLQKLVWAFEDMQSASSAVLAAEQAVASAQASAAQQSADAAYESAKAIADAARAAADEMRSLAATLREFVLGETLTPSELFADTLKKAMGGDAEAMRALPQAATAQMDAARQSASTQADYAIARAQTLNAVSAAAALAETLGSVAIADPGPRPGATGGGNSLDQAITDLTAAVATLSGEIAQTIGVDLVEKLGQIDTNQDGGISEDEFKSAFSGLASNATLKDIFDALDADGSSLISRLEAIKGSTNATALAIGALGQVGTALSAGQITSQQAAQHVADLTQVAGTTTSGKPATMDTATEVVTETGASKVWLSSGGAVAVDSTIYAKDNQGKASIAEAQAFVRQHADAGNLRGVYDAAIKYGISAASLDAMMGWSAGTSNKWAIGAGLPSFSTGGYTGPGGKYEAAGVVHRGEVVFSQDDIARLGGVRAVEAIRTGAAPGYATGGTVGAPVVVPAPAIPGRVAMAPRPAAATPDPEQQEREAQARDQAQREAQQQTQELIQQLRQVNSNLTDLKRSVDKNGQANDQMNNKIFNMADTTVKLLRKFDALGLPVVDVTPVQEAATEEAA